MVYGVHELYITRRECQAMTDLMHYIERKPHEIEDVCLKLILMASPVRSLNLKRNVMSLVLPFTATLLAKPATSEWDTRVGDSGKQLFIGAPGV
jgi:hypothetical protein